MQITHLGKRSIECCLIDEQTAQDRAVSVVGECQPFEPGGPVLIEMPLHPNLIDAHSVASNPTIRRSL